MNTITSQISQSSRDVAKAAAQVFGGKPIVNKFYSEKGSFVNLLTSPNQPCDGVSSYATVGLSDHQNGEVPIHVEMVGACANYTNDFESILTTAAFCLINSGWTCTPDTVFPDIVKEYGCSETMEHLLFVSPFLWETKLETLSYDDKTIAWLQAVPISDAEYQFAQTHGVNKLELLFEEKQIDIFDINRQSVV